MKKQLAAIIIFFMLPILVQAQTIDNIMRSNGRIYVVIAVILLILFGLFIYMVKIEKKIKRLEKEEKLEFKN